MVNVWVREKGREDVRQVGKGEWNGEMVGRKGSECVREGVFR